METEAEAKEIAHYTANKNREVKMLMLGAGLHTKPMLLRASSWLTAPHTGAAKTEQSIWNLSEITPLLTDTSKTVMANFFFFFFP